MSKGSGGTRATNSRSAHATTVTGGGKTSAPMAKEAARLEAAYTKPGDSYIERDNLRRAQGEAIHELGNNATFSKGYSLGSNFKNIGKYNFDSSFSIEKVASNGRKITAALIESTTTEIDVSWSNARKEVPAIRVKEGYTENYFRTFGEAKKYLKTQGYIK